jgi:hypothetical protein
VAAFKNHGQPELRNKFWTAPEVEIDLAASTGVTVRARVIVSLSVYSAVSSTVTSFLTGRLYHSCSAWVWIGAALFRMRLLKTAVPWLMRPP